MKPRSQRLQRVVDLADRDVDDHAQQVGDRQRTLDAALAQLDELRRFRLEYAQPAADAPALQASSLLNRQRFVLRIDQAIEQQIRDIESHRQRLADAQAQWLQARNRHAALDSVAGRYREQERRSEERADQESIDERMQHRRGGWGST